MGCTEREIKVGTIAEKIFERYNATSDEEWRKIIQRSATEPSVDGITFPLVPDPDIQREYVGSTLAENTHEPYQYYKAIKDIYLSHFAQIDEKTKLLDVGSGWGRIIRFFMKDILPKNLFGCDVSSKIIDVCKTSFHGELDFQLIKPLPVTPYENESFDIIEGYSVFSHLSSFAVLHWMNEYFRILKPGGMLAMTVWKESRFDFIQKIQREASKSPESERYLSILQSSLSENCVFERDVYKKSGFVFIPYSSDLENTYGEAFVSPDALMSQWQTMFDHITNFELDVDQQIVILQKKDNTQQFSDETLQAMASVAKMYDIQSICACDYNKTLYKKRNIFPPGQWLARFLGGGK